MTNYLSENHKEISLLGKIKYDYNDKQWKWLIQITESKVSVKKYNIL